MSSLHVILKRFAFALAPLLVCSIPALAQTDRFQPNPNAGPTGVLVHSRFGGQIFGFDIDQNGSEGLLTEAKELSNGNLIAAVETFDQATGHNVAVVQFAQPIHGMDDFVTLGVVGNSVGLFEHEHVGQLFVVSRTFGTLNPLSSNHVNGAWSPPIGTQHLIYPTGLSRNQGVPNVAVIAMDNSGSFIPWVFSSNVANNTFGPIVHINDPRNFGSGIQPPIAYNSANNTALLGGGNGCFGCRPVFAVVDLTGGAVTEFTGTGFGLVNGLAIDAADGIACSTTEDDATVEFYDLQTQTGFGVILPGSGGQQFFSGADVEYDSVNKVFLIAQPNSSTTGSGSSIYVYDIHGNLQETLNGFDFSNSFNVIPTHIALHPSQRLGYVDGPDQGVTELTQFTY